MTYLPTEEDLALLKSRSKRLYCRIELLNKDYQIIDTIEGLALSGSNSIDADSDTRRTFNLDIFPKSGFSISQFSTEEWTSKMLRLQIGMKAPTSMPLVGADAVRIPEEEIDAKIKNSAIYKEKDTELRQAKWRYKVGGYEQYGNIENINRKRIIWTDENKEKYASFVKEQGDVGTYSTVVASSDGYTTNGKTYEIAYTPLLIGGGDVVIPLLNADIRSYIEVIFNAACDAVQRDGSTLQSKILELDSFGVDCMIYGKTVRVKNMIAAVEGGIAAGRILSAADVAAIAGCTKEELDKYFHDTSVFVGYSMHDIQGTIWELKDGLTQIYNFYHALYSGEAEIRIGTNFVDTDGVHWYGAGVYNDDKYMKFHWSGQKGQPTWLWGGNDSGDMYVYNPSNFNVNYATTAGNGTVDFQTKVTTDGYFGAVRFGNGVQICWFTMKSARNRTFLLPFADINYAIAFSGGYCWLNTNNRTTTGFTVGVEWSGYENSYIAIGRWK